jgi:hypothetical protein
VQMEMNKTRLAHAPSPISNVKCQMCTHSTW